MAQVKRSPLHELHKTRGARMTEFAGWELPLRFSGIVDEHRAVRSTAGLFDLSHLGKILVTGPAARDFLQELLTNDCGGLVAGHALYSPMCYPDGGCVDDLIVYALGEEEYLLVTNAANTEKDLAWLLAHRKNHAVTLEDVSPQYAQLALQGPLAADILSSLAGESVRRLGRYRCLTLDIHGHSCLVTRTGYTGEDGFELYLSPAGAADLWETFLREEKIVPVGLGARDTLRLEAGLPLYGHELSPSISPLEAGLVRFVALRKSSFVGLAALRAQAEEGPRRRLIGLMLTERGVPRADYPVLTGDQRVGMVTSGTLSPWTGEAIAMALVAREAAGREDYAVELHHRLVPARRVPLPFYRRRRNGG
ncbi:MAG: glycine cleavage system aminomethyltransferase GcvT [Firmicutes bacterium]|nr:glycine cleavage system aminomethyltransferase GcvT [Bacillota bacterium]